MQRSLLAICILVTPLFTVVAETRQEFDLGARLVGRAVDIIGDSSGYIHGIPLEARGHEQGQARYIAKRMVAERAERNKYYGKDPPAIIMSDDPSLAARVAHLASLHCRAELCAVSESSALSAGSTILIFVLLQPQQERDSKLNLYLNRPNQTVERTATGLVFHT